MGKQIFAFMTSALVLGAGIPAVGQEYPDRPMTQPRVQQQTPQSERQPRQIPRRDEDDRDQDSNRVGGRMMDYHQNWQRRGFMRPGMYGAGDIVGTGTMGSGIMMRMIFTLMDGDGDGTVSSQEFQAAHERIFRGMDANKDGRLTVEEIQAFMQGPRRSLPR